MANTMDEEDDLSRPCTPPTIAEAANIATLNLLPSKSREKYEYEYRRFKEWCATENANKVSENILLAYFANLAKVYKSSTVWSKYSMVKAVILIKENIDISRFSKLIAFLKRNSDGYKAKKSKVFTKEEVDKFMVEAPDEDYLLIKVVAIMGVSGACRRQELTSMSVDDIQDLGSTILVKVPFTKNKIERVFTITTPENSPYNTVEIFRKYSSLRPSHTDHRRFFVFYKKFKCTTQPVGVHTIGKIPTKIAAYLKLTNCELYTGHCFRRCSASFLADSGANLSTIKRHGGWKSSSVAESYIEDSIENKKRIGDQFFSRHVTKQPKGAAAAVGTSTSNVTVTSNESTRELISLDQPGFTVNTNNCSNCKINLKLIFKK